MTKIIFIKPGKLAGITCLLFFIFSSNLAAQELIPVWAKNKKPNSNGSKVSDSLYNERFWQIATPGIYPFLVPKSENKGSAVLICPGGGYERLSYVYNGFQFARWLNVIGVNAFVLLYRLPKQTDLVDPQIAPQQDAQRAMKFIRAHSKEWNINPSKIGVMGISAGGHVATTISTHSNDVSIVGDQVDSFRYRPDFMVLISPVISMQEIAHKGSKRLFLGKDKNEKNVLRYSNELHVSSFTPPTFIVHAQNDSSVSVANSLAFYQSLMKNRISSSLHIFPHGGHGIRLDDNPGSTDLWTELLEKWLKEMKFVEPLQIK